ncbi:MAG: CPBP family intramembrane glutamic endopeptidase [Planctomycetota bacterium]
MGSPTALDHVLALLLGLALPIFSLLGGRGALRGETFDHTEKLALYRWNSIALWIAAAAVVGVWLLADRSLHGLGLSVPRGSWPAGLLACALALAFVLDCWLQIRTPERRQHAREQMGQYAPFLPASRAEFASYALLAVSAGVCEELLFRGHLIRYVQALSGDSPAGHVIAVGLPAVVFALVHLYQGWRAVAKIGLGSVVLGALFLLSGSLWVCIALHVAIDLVGGVLALRLGSVGGAEQSGE